jgi:hypothetical protein
VPGVDAHQTQDLGGLRSQDHHRGLDGLDEQDEFSEVTIVRGPGFDFFPKILDWIVVGRIRRLLVDGEAILVLLKKFTSGFAGVVASTILDEDDLTRDLGKQVG